MKIMNVSGNINKIDKQKHYWKCNLKEKYRISLVCRQKEMIKSPKECHLGNN
jgi:hypothetical protein